MPDPTVRGSHKISGLRSLLSRAMRDLLPIGSSPCKTILIGFTPAKESIIIIRELTEDECITKLTHIHIQ